MSATKSVYLVVAAATAALAACALVVSTPAMALGNSSSAPAFSTSFTVRAPQKVTEEIVLEVQPGMTRNTILALIGAPGRTMSFPRSRTTAWDYDFIDTWGYASELSVIFNDDGIVVGKVTSRNDY